MQVSNHILQNTDDEFDVCCDINGPSVTIEVPSIKQGYIICKTKGVRIRFITEITKDNIRYCKRLIDEQLVSEIRHLDGIKGNFAISDDKVYAATSFLEEAKPVQELIYSNVRGVVEQHHYLFKTLWNKAIPAERRIMEIEEDLLPIETKILEDSDEIFSKVIEIAERTNMGLSNCSTIGGFQLIYDNPVFLKTYQNLIERYLKEEVKDDIRWITRIEDKEEQAELIKKFLSIGVRIRHVNNLPPLYFALSDKTFQATIEKMEKGKMFEKVLYSTDPPYIKHFQSLFDELWKNGVDAKCRISQIEKGIASERTEIIENPNRIRLLYLNLIENADEEILIIFLLLMRYADKKILELYIRLEKQVVKK